MSESRDTGNAQQEEEEEEEKEKEVSKQGSASSSTPMETATEKMTTHDDDGDGDDDDVISQSKSGGGSCSSERANQGLPDRADINQRKEYPMPKTARVGEFQMLVHYLFQVELTQSDIEHGRLSIPFQTAEFHFPSTNRVSNYEQQIVISNTQNDNWYMTLTYNARESTSFKFAITSGWQGFVDWHGLKAKDVIRFYKPFRGLHSRHYLIDYVKREGNVVLPFKNQEVSRMQQDRDEARLDVISETKFGGSCSSERANRDLQDTESEFHRRIFLFELQLSLSDVQQGMLFIPEQRAAKHFPPIPTHLPNYNYEHQIEISDTQNQNWNMTLGYHSLLRAFFITKGWRKFVVRHGLEFMDVICFYKTLSRLHNKQFIIEHVKRGEAETENTNLPEFKMENFLFELQLTSSCVSYNWLKLPKEEVRNHFPVIEIPGGRRLNFTDAQNKDWSMTIFFVQNLDAYVVMDGWDGFWNKHRLKDMDVIRFYKPVLPLHETHFLIECVKREEAASGSTTSQADELGGGGAKKGDNGGDGTNSGGRNHGGGGGGESHGGGGSPGKGKTICCWTWKKQRGGQQKRAVMALEEFLQVTDTVWEEMALISN